MTQLITSRVLAQAEADTDSHQYNAGQSYEIACRVVAWACGEASYPWRSSAHHLRVLLVALALLAAIAFGA